VPALWPPRQRPTTRLVGLPLGIAVYVVAGRDLARMRAGRMDKRGWGRAEAARSRAIDGITLSAPFWYFLRLGIAYLIATGRGPVPGRVGAGGGRPRQHPT
jgi:hypothetical protein